MLAPVWWFAARGTGKRASPRAKFLSGENDHAVEAGLREADGYAELGEVVAGDKAGRESDELIVCDLSVGAQDAAFAEVAWEAVRP